MSAVPLSLALPELAAAYRQRRLSPLELIQDLQTRRRRAEAVWITLTPEERLLGMAQALMARDPQSLPLYGVPFAIKDNIDLAGVTTTAACPDFAYVPPESAHVVERLIAAGALPIGKTNLDQFATGLVGMRSPYGICRNPFDPDYITGGSSSGSALAVAVGMVSFALGTDTAGSGRVPAAFNNLVGLKPTVGRLSPRGMLPACRTLDTMSILALTSEDATRVCRIAEDYDAQAPYSSRPPISQGAHFAGRTGRPFRFGLPRDGQLQFFGDLAYEALFHRAAAQLERLGGERVPIDFAPFQSAAELLYGGPWVAERFIVAESLLSRRPSALHPVTRQIIEGGARPSAADAFRAQYELRRLRRETETTWERIDVLLTPTAPMHPRIAEVEADPIRVNTRLGYYTNFVNLLDLAAVAVPAGFTTAGLPFGVTLIGPAWSDYALLELAARLHRSQPAQLGAMRLTLPEEPGFDWQTAPAAGPDVIVTTEAAVAAEAAVAREAAVSARATGIAVAVCGAHLLGLPLNHQLTERGAVLVESTRTAPVYRLFALAGGPPRRPGLQRVPEAGAPIDVEIWTVPSTAFGSFVAGIPAPLGIGKVLLADGREVCGFICEGCALEGAQDITRFGGWRAYLASLEPGA
jgi:allophanate hydrolase